MDCVTSDEVAKAFGNEWLWRGGFAMTLRRVTASRCCRRGCGEFFNSISAFDRHRGTPYCVNGTPRSRSFRRCLTAEEIFLKGLTQNTSGFWIKESRKGSCGSADAYGETNHRIGYREANSDVQRIDGRISASGWAVLPAETGDLRS